jgi:glucokinase
MATTTSITTTYAGEFAGKYIAAALLSSKTLEDGAIEIKPNVKFKEVIKKVATDSNVIKNATCDFTDTATITLTERILQPEEFQVNLELCKKDFVSDWEAVQMGYSAYSDLPPAFSDFLIGHVAGLVAEKNESNIWGGVNATAGEFDGFTVLMAADSDVNDAVNTGITSFTAANIISALGNVVDALPSAVYGKEDLTIYVPTAAFQAYVRALGGFGASGLGAAGVNAQGTQWYNMGNALAFEGIKVQLTPGMPSDHIVAAQKSNLYFGTGLLSDHNEVKLIDMADIDGSQNVRVVMRFTAGVQYGIGSDVALFTLASA